MEISLIIERLQALPDQDVNLADLHNLLNIGADSSITKGRWPVGESSLVSADSSAGAAFASAKTANDLIDLLNILGEPDYSSRRTDGSVIYDYRSIPLDLLQRLRASENLPPLDNDVY